MKRAYVAATILVVMLVSFVGCNKGKSGPTGTISGKLTLNGQAPPAETQIQFISNEGASGATVAADGSFTLMGVYVGSYKVMVTPGAGSDGGGAMDPEAAMKMVAGEGGEGKASNEAAFDGTGSIPAKYTDIATSGISFDVKEGNNDFVLDMKE